LLTPKRKLDSLPSLYTLNTDKKGGSYASPVRSFEPGSYFFSVYPLGQTGLTAVTFFTSLPLTQVIVVVFLVPPVAVGVVVFWFAVASWLVPVSSVS